MGDWGWLGSGVVAMALCMAMMMWMMGGHGSHASHGSHAPHGSRAGGSPPREPGGAEHVLAERLARGEIDVDEYERRLAALLRSSASQPASEVPDEG